MIPPPPAKYDPLKVGRALLFEVIAQDPARLTIDKLVLRIVSDPDDRREVMTATTAVRELRIAGLVRVGDDKTVEATGAALHADALFSARSRAGVHVPRREPASSATVAGTARGSELVAAKR